MKTMRNGPAFGSTQLYGRRSTGVRSVQEKVTMSRFPQSGAAIIPAHSRRGAFGTHSTDLSDGVDPVTRTEGGASRFPLLPGSFGSVLLALALPLLFPITLIAQPDEKPMVPPVVPVTAPVTSPVVAPATAPVAVDPSPVQVNATRPSPRSPKAKAHPAMTGTRSPTCEMGGMTPLDGSPICRSRPPVMESVVPR